MLMLATSLGPTDRHGLYEIAHQAGPTSLDQIAFTSACG
jgi:hypothetical protein